VLGIAVWRSAASDAALISIDTRRSAISLLAATAPFLTDGEREELEQIALALDFSGFSEPEDSRIEIVGQLFGAIGESDLRTNDAREFLHAAQKTGRSLENRKPIEFRVTSGLVRGHWLEHEGVDTKAPETADLLARAEDVRAAVVARKENQTSENDRHLWEVTSTLDAARAHAQALSPEVDQDVADALAEGLGICLADGLVPSAETAAALDRLVELARHPNPQGSAEIDKQFANHGSWGMPSPRIQAARAIGILATKAEYWPLVRELYEQLLLTDPHPAVRHQVVHVLPWVGQIDHDAMWSIIDRMVGTETNPTLVRQLLNALGQRANSDADLLEPLIIRLSNTVEPKESGDDPVTGLIVHFAIRANRPASRAVLQGWTADFANFEKRLNHALFDVRGYILLGLDDGTPDKLQIRNRARQFLLELMDAVEPAVRAWPQSGRAPTATEITGVKLFDGVANQIFYAGGHDTLSLELTDPAARAAFLSEYGPLISRLSTLGTPAAVHHLITLLSLLLNTDPARCFDLISEALLRTTGVAKYQHESLGADLFVRLVGRFLADYRFLFDDEARRTKLIDCVALFVEAGWPEARRLFQSLPDLLQ
jgi:hypothetical protein